MATCCQRTGFGALGRPWTYSNNSPRGLEVPVRRACLPSMLSMVEYLCDASVSAMTQTRESGQGLHPHAESEAVVYP